MRISDHLHVRSITALIPERSATSLTIILFLLWAAIVATTMAHHEFSRDEVGALTLSLQANSLFTVPATIHGEGHPSLWYLLLRAAYDVFGTKTVLPIVSATIGGFSVILFLWRSPFPLWWKGLFIFSGLPLYEYSVIARNYGISMLLMFLFAIAYTAKTSPFMLGAILFLLANTNVHSAVLVPLFVLIWCWDIGTGNETCGTSRNSFSVATGILLALGGVLLCFLAVYPSHHDLFATQLLERPLLPDIVSVVTVPGKYFRTLLFGSPVGRGVTLTTALVYLGVIGLISRLPLFFSAIVGLWGTAFIFAHIYGGEYRHQGIFFVFLVTLYWIRQGRNHPFSQDKGLGKALALGLYGVLPIFLLVGVGIGLRTTYLDIAYDRSETKKLGEFLRSSPDLRKAIVVAEPDYALMALPYYADNDTYLLRESRYGNFVIFSKTAKLDLSLSDVLDISRRLKADTGRRVLILLVHPLDNCEAEQIRVFGYGWQFRCNREQLKEFQNGTVHLASFQGGLVQDENFEVYGVK